ncbi:MAG: SEC-C metal-binding domain-containing protein [Acidimicrobiales bacterium]
MTELCTTTRSSFEKLGRNDLCPCGSARRFQELLPALRSL